MDARTAASNLEQARSPRACSRYEAVARCGTARQAIALLSAGEPEAILVVPGWLAAPSQRDAIRKRILWAAERWGAPVHLRWIWLREDEDGRTETAFLIWPCTILHRPRFQCRDGRELSANTPIQV